MKQINCTVAGTRTDTPSLVVDNGHTYFADIESPTRVIFQLLDSEPPWGATITFGEQALRYTLPDHPGAYEGPLLTYGPPPSEEIQIVGDHFELRHQRWLVRGADGFCDLALVLDGGDLRPVLRQSQDLGVRVRRVFGAMKNIRDFDPHRYGKGYFDGIRQLFALYAEYGHYGEFDALPDSGYWGWSLSQCLDLWALDCEVLAAIPNRFLSLTNEYDHGGNLVGQPSDYPRPPFALCSQGSAVSDAPPPRPGWGFREFHIAKDWPKIFLCEDMLFNREGVDANGARWGDPKPIYLSETPRFDETHPYTDERLARTLAYESLAFGEGLVMHTEDGKYSRVLGPRQASCVKTAMQILEKAE